VAVFAALACTLLFSVSVVCGHRSAKLIGGTEANFWRLMLATLFLSVWAYGFGVGLAGNALPVFLLSGVVGIGIGDGALFQALPRLGSRLSLLLIQCLTAPFGALIEWCWLGTTLKTGQVICGLTILAGVGLALLPIDHLKRSPRALVVGILFSLVSALAGAMGAVLSRKAYAIAAAYGEAIGGADAAFQRILGGLVVAALCFLFVRGRQWQIQGGDPREVLFGPALRKWRVVWPWVLVKSLAGQTLGVSCMQWALKTTPTGIVLAIIAITPVVIIPFALLLEGERPTVQSVVGGLIAVGGVVALTLWR